MPAPLVAAASYFLAPRVAGGLADLAAQARFQSLIDQGKAEGQTYDEMLRSVRSDPYLNALRMVPSQSGLENTVDIARAFYNGNPYGMRREDIPTGDVSGPDARTIEEILAGRGFNDPNVQPEAYVTRGSPYSEDLQFLTPMDDFLRYGGRDDDVGGRYYQTQSYGQTDQPATEVVFRGGGGANGGLAALIRRGYA